MKAKEQQRLLREYMRTGDTYSLMVREIDRAVRKARKEAIGKFAQQLADAGCEHVNVGRRKPKERR